MDVAVENGWLKDPVVIDPLAGTSLPPGLHHRAVLMDEVDGTELGLLTR